jgi:hypothetical protein
MPQAADLLRNLPTGAPGVTLQGDPATYDIATLRDYLGQDAERYFTYDYQWTVSARLHDGKSGTGLTVDIFRFAGELDAFGAFSLARDPLVPAQMIPLEGQTPGLSAYWAGNQLHVWRGPLYLRITPASAAGDLSAVALVVGQALTEQLPAAGQVPGIFKVAPARDLILETVRYQRRNVLGQTGLGPALIASYGRRQPGKLVVTAELLLFETPNPAGAQTTFATLQTLLTAETQASPVAALGEACLALRHATYGQVYLIRQGRYIGMLRQVKDPQAAEATLRELAKNARQAK